MDNRNEERGMRVRCGVNRGEITEWPMFTAKISAALWRGIIGATAQGSKNPAQILRDAVKEYLERRGLIDTHPIEKGEAHENEAENRVVVMSRNGHVLRQFVCNIPGWAFDALQFAAQNDGQPIGRTTAAAIYHFAEHRGIKPPLRMKAEVEKIAERAHLAANTDIPDTVRDADGGFRRIMFFKAWEREAVRAVANHDGDSAGRTIAHAVRYYVTKVRGVEPPPQQRESVESVRAERDCAFVKLHTGNKPETPPTADEQAAPEKLTATPMSAGV